MRLDYPGYVAITGIAILDLTPSFHGATPEGMDTFNHHRRLRLNATGLAHYLAHPTAYPTARGRPLTPTIPHRQRAHAAAVLPTSLCLVEVGA